MNQGRQNNNQAGADLDIKQATSCFGKFVHVDYMCVYGLN